MTVVLRGQSKLGDSDTVICYQFLNRESVKSIGIFIDSKTYSKKVVETVSNKNESGKKITSRKESPEVPEKPM